MSPQSSSAMLRRDKNSGDTTKVTQRPNSKNKSNLLGRWRYTEDENATFEIRKASIFYFESAATYKYCTSVDSIWIDYGDWIYKGRYQVVNDTLSMINDDEIQRYVRWK